MRTFQILACVDENGVVARKFIATRLESSGLSAAAASEAGFDLSADGAFWERTVTPEIIAIETRHEAWQSTHLFGEPLSIVAGAIEDHPAFPVDTTFKRAWVMRDGEITHDMDRAREIRRDQLRELRAPLLANLDIAYQKADEAGDVTTKQKVSARKQSLRDVTTHPEIDAAADIVALKSAGATVLERQS